MNIYKYIMFLAFAINSSAFNPCMYGNCMHDTYGHPNDVYKAQIISNVGSLNGNTDYNRYIPGAWQSYSPGGQGVRSFCNGIEGQYSYYKRDTGGGNTEWFKTL